MRDLQPVQPTVSVKLHPNEKVYAEYTALRAGIVDGFKTSNTGLGIGGGVGRIGIGIGKSSGEMVANGKFQIIDEGSLLFTNRRMVFVGNGFVDIPYEEINVIDIDEVTFKKQERYRKLFAKRGGSPFGKYRIPSFRRLTAVSVLHSAGVDGEEYLITDKDSSQAKDVYSAVAGSNGQPPKAAPTIQASHSKSTSPVESRDNSVNKVTKSSLNTFTTAGIVLLVAFFPPVGIPLMYKFMKRPSKVAKVVISVVWGFLWLIIAIGSLSDTPKDTSNSPSNATSSSQQAPITNESASSSGDTYMDAMRKCTVMEAYDIHTTGVGAKSDNVFNDGRETCTSLFSSVYDGDEEMFISDVSTDWANNKDNQVDGKPLTHYLDILGW